MSSSFSILIIDDEPNLRRTISVILQKAGYQVTTASNASDAIQNLVTGPYDLVFLDIRMPEMDGMTLLPKIRLIYPEMPVIILTAHATLETAMEAVRQGARDYLVKPIDPKQILARVEDILSTQKHPVRRRQIVSQIQELINELNSMDNHETPQPTPQKPSGGNIDPSRYLHCGPFILDLHTRYVRLDERQIALPPSTFDIFVTLVRRSPNPVSYETLLSEALGYTLTRSEAREMARWQIHELRKALEPDQKTPKFIITVRDVGYRLVV